MTAQKTSLPEKIGKFLLNEKDHGMTWLPGLVSPVSKNIRPSKKPRTMLIAGKDLSKAMEAWEYPILEPETSSGRQKISSKSHILVSKRAKMGLPCKNTAEALGCAVLTLLDRRTAIRGSATSALYAPNKAIIGLISIKMKHDLPNGKSEWGIAFIPEQDENSVSKGSQLKLSNRTVRTLEH